MIEIKQLSYRYAGASQNALSDINLHIERGCAFGLLGPNGAGKTTLISLITGLLESPADSILIDGLCLQSARKNNPHQLGYIPQEYAFYPNMSGRENLQFFAGIQGLTGATARQRIDFALDFCQLQEFAERRAQSYSGGLKRRLNIAIGLLTDPDILLFDEPTVGIDPQSRAFILEQIQTLCAAGKTVIYTSHYMEEVEKLCDRLALIDHGKLLFEGEADELKRQQRQLTVVSANKISPPQRDTIERLGGHIDSQQINFTDSRDSASASAIIAELKRSGIDCDSFYFGGQSLEDLFLQLTEKNLRDH